MTSLASLLEQSQRLDQSHHLPSTSSTSLPSLALDLSTIESQSRRIASRSTHPTQDSTYLLSRAGLNPTELRQNINQLNPTATFEPLLPLGETDLEGFVKHSHEQVIISAIEEGRRSTMKDFYTRLEQTSRRNWEKQKEGLWEELGRHGINQEKTLTNEKKASTNGPSTSSQTHLNQSSSSSSSSLQMHSKMMRYDLVISRLNKFRLESYSFALISSLLEASISPSSSNSSSSQGGSGDQVTETWRLLASLVGEKDVLNGEFQRKSLGEREFRNAYLEGDGMGQESKELRRMLTRGGKEYLEGQFMQYVEKTLASKLSSANLGGIPSIQNKIRAFIEVKYKKSSSSSSKDSSPEWSNPSLEIANNTPIWARIYYLLRSGHAQESLSFAVENQSELNKLEKSFVAYYKSWIDSSTDPASRRLPKLLRDRFLSEYNQRLRYTSPSSDPYKFALYKLLGRVDLSKRNVPGVTQTTEDWVWFQLSLLREDEEEDEGGHERYGLRELGNVLRRFGEGHFSPGGKRPMLYFQVLILSGQFELAVAFLYEQQQYQVDAVHFAIALTYYGLLRISPSTSSSSSTQNSLLSDPSSDSPSIAFSRLIHRYTRSFVHSDPLEALQYLYLICLNGDLSTNGQGKKEVQICHELVRELVMDTRQYSALLGDVRNDGTKIAGQIEKDLKLLQLPDSKTYLLSIVKSAAQRANSEQRFSEAILLYNLAEEYDSVIQVLNTELSNSLSSPSTSITSKTGHSLDGNAYFAKGSQTMGGMTNGNQEVGEVAKSILEHYERSSAGMMSKVTRKNRETCLVLMRLKEGMRFYEQSQYEQALQTIESTSLIPLSSDLVTIIRASEELKNLPDSILRNLDLILLTTMTTLYKLHQQLKESLYGADQSRQEKMLELRSKGRSLIMFAGMLRYRLTSETYSQLTRLDVFLH